MKHISSRFGRTIDIHAPRPEYPRMQLRRDSFYNLNGIWEYQIAKDGSLPDRNRWKPIVVPFPLGSSLSGSDEELMPDETLWYRKQFSFRPDAMRVMLNFEAVDCMAEVYLNGQPVGRHYGGYAPFCLEVTPYIKYQNALMVKVKDKSDLGSFAFGKQALHHGGMFYTPQSGIWGTVWLEKIPDHAVRRLRITPEFDHQDVLVEVFGSFDQAVLTVSSKGTVIETGLTEDGRYRFHLDPMHAWTPEDPFLYDLSIQTEDDRVESYFGMRKFSAGYDAEGKKRFLLNNIPYFFSGVLDQGYSCEGGYAYPSEEAMIWEIETLKNMGFNCLRKHVKIECRRWYYLCDKMGMLVMQDMPSGGYDHYDPFVMGVLPTIGLRHLKDTGRTKFGRVNEESENHYLLELKAMIRELYNVTSLFAWVPFNEGWGQFQSRRVEQYIRQHDETRLIDAASGWFDQGNGDFLSIHDYFFPYHVHKREDRIQILSEFGGFSFVESGRSAPEKLYGYRKYDDKAALNHAVFSCYERMVQANVEKGLSGCIFTQAADIEDECNGIFTADRSVIKLDQKRMRRLNENIRKRIKI